VNSKWKRNPFSITIKLNRTGPDIKVLKKGLSRSRLEKTLQIYPQIIDQDEKQARKIVVSSFKL
jgi:hypothetical protein